jgi:hypothetical protein
MIGERPNPTHKLAVERGDLREFVTAFKETLPGLDSQGFRQPEPPELEQLMAALETALTGQPSAALPGLDRFDYDLLHFEDATSGASHLMLRERQPMQRGWGLLLVNLAPTARRALIEVPHPIWDSKTPELAIEAYLGLEASHFLMAGAHRFANGRPSPVSDMARNLNSLFMALHRRLADAVTPTLQYHGFHADSHPGYPNIVLSNGSPDPHPELFTLQAAFEAAGESGGVFDGRQWTDLGATNNPQAAHTRALGGRFYHLEHRYGVRARPHRREAVVAATRAVLFGA